MSRVAALACAVVLAAAAAAGEAERAGFFTPTYLEWEGGDKSLTEALAWLRASGNATMLAAHLDGTVVAPVDFVSGTYWEAVLAVCRAYNLYVVGTGSHRGTDGHHLLHCRPMSPVFGPVQLALVPGKELGGVSPEEADKAIGTEVDVERLRKDPEALRAFLDRKIRVANRRRDRHGPRPPTPPPAAEYLADGALLVMVEDAGIWSETDGRRSRAEVRVAFRFRLEPRFTPRETGACLLVWTEARAADGKALSFTPAGRPPTGTPRVAPPAPGGDRGDLAEGLPAAITWRFYGIDRHAAGFSLVGKLHLRYLLQFEERVELKPGETVELKVRDRTLEVTLRAEPPAVVLRYPADARWLDRVQANVSRLTGPLMLNAGTATAVEEGMTVRTVSLRELPQDRVHRVHLGAEREERPTAVPFRLDLDIP